MAETTTQQALTIAKGSNILIDDHPCKVSKVTYNEDRCIFDAYDMFSSEKHTIEYRATDLCTCPIVYDNVYRIWHIFDDGRMRVQSCLDRRAWGYMTLPMPNLLPHPHVPNADGQPDPNPDATFIAHYQNKIAMGGTLFLDIKYVMGREHIVAIKERIDS